MKEVKIQGIEGGARWPSVFYEWNKCTRQYFHWLKINLPSFHRSINVLCQMSIGLLGMEQMYSAIFSLVKNKYPFISQVHKCRCNIFEH
jgi:hypothetical protein